MDQETVRWIIGALATAMSALAGWTWREHNACEARVRELTERLSNERILRAVCETKLDGYGITVPDLNERLRQLAYRVDPTPEDNADFYELPHPREDSWPRQRVLPYTQRTKRDRR